MLRQTLCAGTTLPPLPCVHHAPCRDGGFYGLLFSSFFAACHGGLTPIYSTSVSSTAATAATAASVAPLPLFVDFCGLATYPACHSDVPPRPTLSLFPSPALPFPVIVPVTAAIDDTQMPGPHCSLRHRHHDPSRMSDVALPST